jgi:hypothetical protein
MSKSDPALDQNQALVAQTYRCFTKKANRELALTNRERWGINGINSMA